MNRDLFLNRLRRAEMSSMALGIDLGTTKSCVAYAMYDAEFDTFTCDCFEFEGPIGDGGVAVPSAVAVQEGRILVGEEARTRRGERGFLPEKSLFLECKNDVGLRYTYAKAPPSLNTAEKVAGVFLEALHSILHDVCPEDMYAVDPPTLIAVPASFQGAQRLATIRAGESGFAEENGDAEVHLLDEPYAAYLDLVVNAPELAEPLVRDGANLMVFDFGGGTCDVAIFRSVVGSDDGWGARLLGTSRYQRLGGGDIDRAIAHDVLMPALLDESGLDRWAASWHEKRKHIEPPLLVAAEHLKIAWSEQAARQASSDNIEVEIESLGFEAEVGGVLRELRLSRPRLDSAAMAEVLRPILDPEPPPEAGDEYVERGSIFSPIVQAMFRAGLEPAQIDGIILCGTSSLLLPVQDAIKKHFPNARIVRRGKAEDLQGTVARGAALQALSLQVFGEPLIAPVCSSDIALRVTSGAVPLIRAGEWVPARSQAPIVLRPPRDSREEPVEIAVEAVAEGQRVVGRSVWLLPPPVSTSDRLALEWSVDENQCMELRLRREGDDDGDPFVHQFDAPFTHRNAGQVIRNRMLERCELIRTGSLPRSDFGNAFEQIARDCSALGEHERSLHFLTLAMQEKGESPGLLNLRGMERECIGNRDGARHSYAKAAEEWPAARFNLALMYYRNGNDETALETINQTIEEHPKRAYKVLRGDILARLGRAEEARAEWQDAISGQPDWSEFEDFDLGWLQRAASRLDQQTSLERFRALRQERSMNPAVAIRQGELPVFVSAKVDVASQV